MKIEDLLFYEDLNINNGVLATEDMLGDATILVSVICMPSTVLLRPIKGDSDAKPLNEI